MMGLEPTYEAVLEWIETQDPEEAMVIVFTRRQAGTLHFLLAILQWMLEQSPKASPYLDEVGDIRKRVEAALVQAGYGGDPRP